mgnify:FL=1|tara:strand:- start:94 stop:324 length:231 start_codon:yes stop_codon:yes gene_type:complete
MDERGVAGEVMNVGDLVRFRSIDDVLGLMNGSIGLVIHADTPETIRVQWLSGLLAGQTTSTYPFQLEKIEPIEGEE